MKGAMANQLKSKHLQEMVIFFAYLTSVCVGVVGPEQGIYYREVKVQKDFVYYEGFTKNMYKDTSVSLKVTACEGGSFNITWVIRFSECEGTYNFLGTNGSFDVLSALFEEPTSYFDGETYLMFYKSKQEVIKCDDYWKPLEDDSSVEWIAYEVPQEAPTSAPAQTDQGKGDSYVKRNTYEVPQEVPLPVTAHTDQKKHWSSHQVTKSKRDGRYLFIIKMESVVDVDVKIEVGMKSPKGYLSAFDWPLLPFYGVMCCVFLLFLLIWLLALVYNSHSLKKIHFWICVVLVIGLLEKVVYLAEFTHVNKYGTTIPAPVLFALDLVSCIKRVLSRILFLLVSLGYGIKRLPIRTKTKGWLIGVGTLYFILCALESCFEIGGWFQQYILMLILILPLLVLDLSILVWIFVNLANTIKHLKVHQNFTKLQIYKYVTSAFVLYIACSVIFFIWWSVTHITSTCVTKWQSMWLNNGFWPMLFAVSLVGIMGLSWPTPEHCYDLMDIDLAPVESLKEHHHISDSDSVKQHPVSEVEPPSDGQTAADSSVKDDLSQPS